MRRIVAILLTFSLAGCVAEAGAPGTLGTSAEPLRVETPKVSPELSAPAAEVATDVAAADDGDDDARDPGTSDPKPPPVPLFHGEAPKPGGGR
jgi:hypothetical protein